MWGAISNGKPATNRNISGKTMNKEKIIDREEVEALRREYAREELNEDSVKQNPVDQFSDWFKQALSAESLEPNAMTLATSTPGGSPSARIVLLKGFDNNGFRFYTNYNSRKGRELQENPEAALCIFWAELERQVRIEGRVEKLSREESRDYFHQRPRLSQLGAWASEQSSELESRKQLKERFEKVKKQYKNQEIPLPEYWGGFILVPSRIEFWQGRPGRMHDRLLFLKSNDGWDLKRLSP